MTRLDEEIEIIEIPEPVRVPEHAPTSPGETPSPAPQPREPVSVP